MRAPLIFLALVLATLLPLCCTPPDFRFESTPDGNCGDQTKNGNETDRDCGGLQCQKCQLGQACKRVEDCVNGACFDGKCQAAHCTDNERNFDETDDDCGGAECPGCDPRQKCLVNTDCRQKLCLDEQCVPTTCGNEEKDGPPLGDETDRDCGGTSCPPCAIGKRCDFGGDCVDGACNNMFCVPMSCANNEFDPGEEGVDCGGTCEIGCDLEEQCSDKMPSSLETDVDCGGVCDNCMNGKRCLDGTDCESAYCLNMVCRDDPCVAAGTCGGEGGAGGSSGAGGESPNPTGGTQTGGTEPGVGGTVTETGGMSSVDGGEPSGGTTGGMRASGGTPSGGTATGGASTGGASTGGMPPGPLTSCPGCAKLTVPLDGEDDRSNFALGFSNTVDFSSAVITARVYKQSGTGGRIKLYVQHSGNPDYSQLFQNPGVPLSALSGWTTFSFPVGEQAAQNFDKRVVGRIGVQLTGDTGSDWETTVVFVDSISVMGASIGPWNFTDSGSVGSPSATGTPGVMFLNSGDDPIANSQLGWLGGG